MKQKVLNIDFLKKHHKMIHFFGLGFIQIKLSPTLRLHVYDTTLPSFTESIHNHRYNFSSYILKGELFQEIYTFKKGSNFLLTEESCQEGDSMESPSVLETLDIDTHKSISHKAGERYSIHHDTFHQVAFKENTITLLKRDPFYRKDKAHVILGVNDEKICPFAKKIKESTLWGKVDSIIKC